LCGGTVDGGDRVGEMFARVYRATYHDQPR
jgi:hypothetical protein